jgi:hypothetical protein
VLVLYKSLRADASCDEGPALVTVFCERNSHPPPRLCACARWLLSGTKCRMVCSLVLRGFRSREVRLAGHFSDRQPGFHHWVTLSAFDVDSSACEPTEVVCSVWGPTTAPARSARRGSADEDSWADRLPHFGAAALSRVAR